MKSYSSSNNSILLAPNAFKGSLKAEEFCQILSEELSDSGYTVCSYPMCDGGDGTASIIAFYHQAKPVLFSTIDALGRPHEIVYYISEKTAILDLATICGIQYLKPYEYDVYQANTAGLGKVLLHLSEQNINHIILGVGGSASIDGGIGALLEMGLQIEKNSHDKNNHLIDLISINANKLKEKFKHIRWTILCDVENVLCGEMGAACTFGPQKGANPQQIETLDHALNQYASMLWSETAIDVLPVKHGGAAGGIAAAFYALFHAQLVSGAEYCLEISNFQERLAAASYVITGEGRMDMQSLGGKLPGVISLLCQKHQIPIIGIAGSVEPPLPYFQHLYCLLDYADDLTDAIQHPQKYLRQIAKELKRELLKL